MDLMQHVDVCTHKQCHTLNLVTTSRFDCYITSTDNWTIFFLIMLSSFFSLNWVKAQASARLTIYRKLKPMCNKI